MNPTEKLQFKDPPATRRSDWGPAVAQLQAHPGEWAVIATKKTVGRAYAMSSAIRRGQYRAFRPAGHFEATARGLKVYARYVGDES